MDHLRLLNIISHSAPDDYEPINRTLTFDSERSSLVVPVRIINDGVDEENEQLLSRLQLEPVEGDSPNVQVLPNQATLTILDDDGKISSLSKFINKGIFMLLLLNFRHLNWL